VRRTSADILIDWTQAQAALKAAQNLPAGAERVEALRRAGQMRFDAVKSRLEYENV
jgi:hypothetical protein